MSGQKVTQVSKTRKKTLISCPIKVIWFDTEKLRGGVY